MTTLGVTPEPIYVEKGLIGTNRDRPGLREAMAACRAGDVLVVTKFDRLARSLPDARDIVAELTAHQVTLSLGESLHDPTDPVGRLLFTVLAMVAEFESHLIKIRTREGMKAAATPSTLPEGFRTPAIMDAPHSRASTGPATTDPRAHAATSRPPGSYEKNAHIRGQHAVVAIAALQSGATFGDAPQQA